MKKVKYSKNISQRTEKKKKVPKEVIWSLFIAIIMISSIIGFIYSGDTEADYTYKDKFKFVRSDRNSFIYKDADNNQFEFRNLPFEVEDLNITADIKPPMVHLSFDPDSENIEVIELMRFELLEDFGKLDIYTDQGIMKNSSSYNLNIVNCNKATPAVAVIRLVGSNETRITENNNCITLEGKNPADIIRLKERLLYKVLEII